VIVTRKFSHSKLKYSWTPTLFNLIWFCCSEIFPARGAWRSQT